MLVKKAPSADTGNRQSIRRALGALKIAAPLVRATIVRPGVDAEGRDVGKTFATLAMRTRSLAERLWETLRRSGASDGHRADLFRLAQQAAWHVGTHWMQGGMQRASLDEQEMTRLLEEALRLDDHLSATEDPGYRGVLPKSMEWRISWARAVMTVAGAVANGTSTLGHDPAELRQMIYAHMRDVVTRWAAEFGARDDEERMLVEQSLLGVVASQYAQMWLHEIDRVRAVFRRMSEAERMEAGRKGHSTDDYFRNVEQVINQVRESIPLVEQAFAEASLNEGAQNKVG